MKATAQDLRPRVNRLSDLQRFLFAWDEPDAYINHVPILSSQTEGGNINCSGQPGDYSGLALSRWHCQFDQVLEPGIAPLVRLIIEHFDWITYSSCEGHPNPGSNLQPFQRHVGLLPRDDQEAADIRHTLSALINACHQLHPPRTISLEMLDYEVHSAGGRGGDLVRPAIDLFFRRLPETSWPDYFEALPDLTETVLQQLRALAER